MVNIPQQCDVVVIGGGPAGTMAATCLAQKGYEVTLFEKEVHPRYHVGESLIPHFWRYCDDIGVSQRLEEVGFIEKSGGTVRWSGKLQQMSFKDFAYKRPALHVERNEFDAILIDHARQCGVNVCEQVTVLDANFSDHDGESQQVKVIPEDVTKPSIVTCKQVIDASGQQSLLAKKFGFRKIDPAFRFASLWGYFDNSDYVAYGGTVHTHAELKDTPPTTYVTSLAEVLDGSHSSWNWLWHIPMRETTSVGIVVDMETLKNAKKKFSGLESFYLDTCNRIPDVKHLLRNARYREGEFNVINNYSYRISEVTRPGYFLCGDAAGFVDPIFSIGVVIGMYSGQLAAWSVDRCLRKTAHAETARALYSQQLMARLDLARTLALPNFNAEKDQDGTRELIDLETQREQELIAVVASLTNRSPNVEVMMNQDHAAAISERILVLDQLLT